MDKATEEFRRLKGNKKTVECGACKRDIDDCVCSEHTKSGAKQLLQNRIYGLSRELQEAQRRDSNNRELVEKLRFALGELEALKSDIGRLKYGE